MRIELQQISKAYKTALALDSVSFMVASGELVVILGPSGCGKSTLLRIIAGLDDASSGQVLIGERDVTRLPPAQRGISMVFQSYALFPHLSVAENIVFGLRIRGRAKSEINRRLEQAAEMLGLGQLLNRKPAQLSGGQRQRVALGRAIVSQKPICLMDEPLSNLDAKLRHEMRREILELQRTLNITLVYVTHDQVEAITMADRIVLLNQGRIAQIAPPEELYSRPSTIFAAQFIGSPPMNLLRLEPGPTGCVIKGDGMLLMPGFQQEPLFVGVRPEDVRPSDDGLPSRIISTEYHGADTLVSASLGENILVMRLSGRHGFKVGDNVRLAWNTEQSHVFSSTTGNRREDLQGLLKLPPGNGESPVKSQI